MTLHIYMGFDSKAGSTEGAILIFANTSKEARKVGWGTMKALLNTAWIDMTVKRLRNNLDYLYGDAVQSKLEAEIPHAVDNMRDCPSCNLFGEHGGPIDENGHCGYCRDQ